jgi:ubiquinone/menaquinone biosynthesis C-methylase UbiE
MNIQQLQRAWNELGKKDAMQAALYKKVGKWRKSDFFATGIEEINSIMNDIGLLGVDLPRKKALDFGCGAGRLTQALANYFSEVSGIDIAPSMIALANKYNHYPEKCKYYVNNSNDLAMFKDDTFDLIYSAVTLQHMEVQYVKNYISEFLRVLSRDGILIFQMPSNHAKNIKGIITSLLPEALLNSYRRAIYGHEMYAIKREEMIEFFKQKNSIIVMIKEDRKASDSWVSFSYYVKKL